MANSYKKIKEITNPNGLEEKELLKFLLETLVPTSIFIPGVNISEGVVDIAKFKSNLAQRYLSNPDSNLSREQVTIKKAFKTKGLLVKKLKSYFDILILRAMPDDKNCSFEEGVKIREKILKEIGTAIFKKDILADDEFYTILQMNNEITDRGFFLSEPYLPGVTEERFKLAIQLLCELDLALNVDAVKHILLRIEREQIGEIVVLIKESWENALKARQSTDFNLPENEILEKIGSLYPSYIQVKEQIDKYVEFLLKQNYMLAAPFEVEETYYGAVGYEPIRKDDLAEIYNNGQCQITYFGAVTPKFKKIASQADVKVFTINDLYISTGDIEKILNNLNAVKGRNGLNKPVVSIPQSIEITYLSGKKNDRHKWWNEEAKKLYENDVKEKGKNANNLITRNEAAKKISDMCRDAINKYKLAHLDVTLPKIPTAALIERNIKWENITGNKTKRGTW